MAALDSHRGTNQAIETVWRMESARLIAGLTRFSGNLERAEELAQDALVAAIERWPKSGVPKNPGAWLMTTAKNRAIDLARREANLAEKHQQIGRDSELDAAAAGEVAEAAIEDTVGDDLLELMFMCCHPLLPREARVALTLRMLGGLSTSEIAKAFLTSEATVAQRIVRAKKKLAHAEVMFELPGADELPDRLGSVLEVIYLIFNEGYAASSGEHWTRPELCEEAMRLGRILAVIAPRESEAHGLIALMELQGSRLRARQTTDGEPILLQDQDRGQWDRLLIKRGLHALQRAKAAGGAGPYLLQAAIAACHATAITAEQTDWRKIVSLYTELVELTRSPVVELNRAVAISMAYGAKSALPLVDALAESERLAGYHLLPAVRGDLLEQVDRRDEARREFERAATLTANQRERQILLNRAAALINVATG